MLECNFLSASMPEECLRYIEWNHQNRHHTLCLCCCRCCITGIPNYDTQNNTSDDPPFFTLLRQLLSWSSPWLDLCYKLVLHHPLPVSAFHIPTDFKIIVLSVPISSFSDKDWIRNSDVLCAIQLRSSCNESIAPTLIVPSFVRRSGPAVRR